VEEDSVFYYRIHSPVLLGPSIIKPARPFPIQRALQKDRIHVIVRRPNGNDYGRNLLRQHYQRSWHRV
jgi:hypothetical protein